MEPTSPLHDLPELERSEIAALAGMYRLLARHWLRELDEELLATLHTSQVRDAYLQAGGILPEFDHPALLEQLAADYCQLFIGPADHLPPYESIWRSGLFQGQAARSMAQFVELTGGIEPWPESTMRDHLGIQLDVMGRVLATAADAVDSQRALLTLAQAFFARHLVWPAPLFERASRQASTEFYRGMIALTAGFLESEARLWSPK